MKRLFVFVAVAMCMFAAVSCQSAGEKAADEVLNCVDNGNEYAAATLYFEYLEKLSGEDLIDFQTALDAEGFYIEYEDDYVYEDYY